MKTIYGQCVSVKEISLPKATKILSKFAFAADNGASQVVTAYLHRASSSFIELDNLHKDLKSNKRHKRQAEAGDEKSTDTKLNGSIGYKKGNFSGIEKRMKRKHDT